MFLPPAGGQGGGAKDEAGLPLDWKTARLRSTSNASSSSSSSGDTTGLGGLGDDSGARSSNVDKATNASEEILQMLRASLKATSPFKFMTDLNLSQLQGQGQGQGLVGSNSSEKTQEVLLQERRKNLKSTGTPRRDIGRAGDDTTDLQSVISEQTMESYHGNGGNSSSSSQPFNDGEVAVANPVEWLEAKKKNLRPTSLRLLQPSHGTTEETLDDQRSVGKPTSTSNAAHIYSLISRM